MPNLPVITIVGLVVAAALGTGFLLGRRRLAAMDRRAALAEARAASYLQAMEALSSAGAPRSGEPAKETSAPRPGNAAGPLEPGYLFVSFEEEIRRASARGTPLTILALSVAAPADAESDRTSSDRLLRRIAHVVRGQMRGCDTCVRYAADEFILILPDVSREEARRLEARMRVAVQGISFETRAGLAVRPRPSLGYATFPEEGGTFDQLFTLADTRRRRDHSGPAVPAADSDPLTPYRVASTTLSRN